MLRTGAADNDIALIQLDPDSNDLHGNCVRFDNRTRPICLPRRADYLRTNFECFITGWGYTGTDYQATFSPSIRRAKVDLTPFAKCKNAYGEKDTYGGFTGLRRPVKLTRRLPFVNK